MVFHYVVPETYPSCSIVWYAAVIFRIKQQGNIVCNLINDSDGLIAFEVLIFFLGKGGIGIYIFKHSYLIACAVEYKLA